MYNQTSINYFPKEKQWTISCEICDHLIILPKFNLKPNLMIDIYSYLELMKFNCFCDPNRGDRCLECWKAEPQFIGNTTINFYEREKWYSSYFCDENCWFNHSLNQLD